MFTTREFKAVEKIARKHGGKFSVSDKDMERGTISWIFQASTSRDAFAAEVARQFGGTGKWARSEFDSQNGFGLTIG